MSLFDFEQYDSKQVPSGEIHLVNQTNDEIESINLDQYIEDRNVIPDPIPMGILRGSIILSTYLNISYFKISIFSIGIRMDSDQGSYRTFKDDG